MKRKIIEIKEQMVKIIQPICNEKFWIDWYGAYDIDPKHLTFWICVQSDKIKIEFESDIELKNKLRGLLEKYDYPEQARQFIHIGFESQETVDRESNGNWYNHFK